MTDEASDPDRRAEVRRVADALRAVIERFVATTAPAEVFHGVADDLEAVAARLDGYPQGHVYTGFSEAANAPSRDIEFTGDTFDNSPLMGLSNPLAPPLRLEMLADRVVGTVVFGAAYEGPPGHVHGGYVAAAFDELLGMTQGLSGNPGMTGRLTVHYRSPTPLNTELRLEAAIEKVSGRKILVTGRITAGDTLCAEAEGLFISIDFARFAAMIDRREAATQANVVRDESL